VASVFSVSVICAAVTVSCSCSKRRLLEICLCNRLHVGRTEAGTLRKCSVNVIRPSSPSTWTGVESCYQLVGRTFSVSCLLNWILGVNRYGKLVRDFCSPFHYCHRFVKIAFFTWHDTFRNGKHFHTSGYWDINLNYLAV